MSSDSIRAHQRFARKHVLPFVLLSDEGGEVRKLYVVPNTLRLFPARKTYVTHEDGVVRHVFGSQLQASRHVEQALKALKSIS